MCVNERAEFVDLRSGADRLHSKPAAGDWKIIYINSPGGGGVGGRGGGGANPL